MCETLKTGTILADMLFDTSIMIGDATSQQGGPLYGNVRPIIVTMKEARMTFLYECYDC